MEELLFMRKRILGRPLGMVIFEGWNDINEVKSRWELISGVYPNIGTYYLNPIEGKAFAYVTGNSHTRLRLKMSDNIVANTIIIDTFLASPGIANMSHHSFKCYTADLKGEIELLFMNNYGEVWLELKYNGSHVDTIYCSNRHLGYNWVRNRICFIRFTDKLELKWIYDVYNEGNAYHVCSFEVTDERFIQPFRRLEFFMLARAMWGVWDYPAIDSTYIRFFKTPVYNI